MRHTILVKHIYCAIYFAFLFLSYICAFRKLRHLPRGRKRDTFLFACSAFFPSAFMPELRTDDKRFELRAAHIATYILVEIINLVIFY